MDGSFISLEGVFVDSEEGKESVSDWVVVETPDEEIGSDEFNGSFEQPTNVIRMSKQSSKISLRIGITSISDTIITQNNYNVNKHKGIFYEKERIYTC